MIMVRRRHRGRVFGKTHQKPLPTSEITEDVVNVDVNPRKNFSRIVVDRTLV